MGNVSDSVVGYAHCPVLIVRNEGTITREAEERESSLGR